jgi:hypothetical protein
MTSKDRQVEFLCNGSGKNSSTGSTLLQSRSQADHLNRRIQSLCRPAVRGTRMLSQNEPGFSLRDHNIATFVQHDWKVTQNFTLNTGLRWEYFEPLYNLSSLSGKLLQRLQQNQPRSHSLRHTERNRGELSLRPLAGSRRRTRNRLLPPSRFLKPNVLRKNFRIATPVSRIENSPHSRIRRYAQPQQIENAIPTDRK